VYSHSLKKGHESSLDAIQPTVWNSAVQYRLLLDYVLARNQVAYDITLHTVDKEASKGNKIGTVMSMIV